MVSHSLKGKHLTEGTWWHVDRHDAGELVLRLGLQATERETLDLERAFGNLKAHHSNSTSLSLTRLHLLTFEVVSLSSDSVCLWGEGILLQIATYMHVLFNFINEKTEILTC